MTLEDSCLCFVFQNQFIVRYASYVHEFECMSFNGSRHTTKNAHLYKCVCLYVCSCVYPPRLLALIHAMFARSYTRVLLGHLYQSVNGSHHERWGAGVETQKNVRREIGGWGRVPFNEPYAPSLSTIYDGA